MYTEEELEARKDMVPMIGAELEKEALELIDLAMRLGPEGEGIDVVDREYLLEDMIRLKGTLSRIRTATEVANRALAEAWMDQYGNVAMHLDGDNWWVAHARKVIFQDNMARPFAEWLKAQPVETIEKVVSVASIRVTPLGAAKDTFLDTKPSSAHRTIQHKPITKKKG